jgi:ABC-type multidrug transport system permease subunit
VMHFVVFSIILVTLHVRNRNWNKSLMTQLNGSAGAMSSQFMAASGDSRRDGQSCDATGASSVECRHPVVVAMAQEGLSQSIEHSWTSQGFSLSALCQFVAL